MLGADGAAPSAVAMDDEAPCARLQLVSVTREAMANDHIGGPVWLGVVAALLRCSDGLRWLVLASRRTGGLSKFPWPQRQAHRPGRLPRTSSTEHPCTEVAAGACVHGHAMTAAKLSDLGCTLDMHVATGDVARSDPEGGYASFQCKAVGSERHGQVWKKHLGSILGQVAVDACRLLGGLERLPPPPKAAVVAP